MVLLVGVGRDGAESSRTELVLKTIELQDGPRQPNHTAPKEHPRRGVQPEIKPKSEERRKRRGASEAPP